MTPQEQKVMGLALEALETELAVDMTNGGEIGEAAEKMCEAITAIKEALAQPEQEPVAWMHVMDNTEGLKANGTGIVSITQKRKHPFGKAGVDFSKSYPVISTPLYTTPPQRKPLTDEQIDKAWRSCDYTVPWDQHRIDIARAIEAAHGVKENT